MQTALPHSGGCKHQIKARYENILQAIINCHT